MCFESDNDYIVWRNAMRTNNNLVDFASISTYVGSESLVLDFYYLGQYYTETKYNIIADTAQQYICDWLSENSYPEPNYLKNKLW